MRHAVLWSIVAFGAACGTKSDPVDANGETTPVTFDADVEPILTARCTGCHSSALTGSERNGAPAGLNWDDYASAAAHSERIYLRCNAGTMPPNGPKLTDDEISVLLAWDTQGAPE